MAGWGFLSDLEGVVVTNIPVSFDFPEPLHMFTHKGPKHDFKHRGAKHKFTHILR